MATTLAPHAPPFMRPRVRIRVSDLVVLTIVGGCVLEASAKLLSGRDAIVQTVMVIAWTAAAAKRLVDWRHAKARPLALEGGSQALAVVVGMAPWFMLLVMNGSFHDWSPWASVTFPPVFRLFGAVLIVAGMLHPFWVGLRDRNAPSESGAFAYAFGFLLLSSSPLIGVLATGWLAIRCCVHRQPELAAPAFV